MRQGSFQFSGFSFQCVVLALAGMFMCGCGKPAPPPVQNPGPVITLMPQYPLGMDFEKLVEAEHLQGAPVREAATSTGVRRDLVYFGLEGDLHVSVKRDATGREVLNATPFIVPSSLTAGERMAKWDNGVDRSGTQSGRVHKK
jgi:hypothetical protein